MNHRNGGSSSNGNNNNNNAMRDDRSIPIDHIKPNSSSTVSTSASHDHTTDENEGNNGTGNGAIHKSTAAADPMMSPVPTKPSVKSPPKSAKRAGRNRAHKRSHSHSQAQMQAHSQSLTDMQFESGPAIIANSPNGGACGSGHRRRNNRHHHHQQLPPSFQSPTVHRSNREWSKVVSPNPSIQSMSLSLSDILGGDRAALGGEKSTRSAHASFSSIDHSTNSPGNAKTLLSPSAMSAAATAGISDCDVADSQHGGNHADDASTTISRAERQRVVLRQMKTQRIGRQLDVKNSLALFLTSQGDHDGAEAYQHEHDEDDSIISEEETMMPLRDAPERQSSSASREDAATVQQPQPQRPRNRTEHRNDNSHHGSNARDGNDKSDNDPQQQKPADEEIAVMDDHSHRSKTNRSSHTTVSASAGAGSLRRKLRASASSAQPDESRSVASQPQRRPQSMRRRATTAAVPPSPGVPDDAPRLHRNNSGGTRRVARRSIREGIGSGNNASFSTSTAEAMAIAAALTVTPSSVAKPTSRRRLVTADPNKGRRNSNGTTTSNSGGGNGTDNHSAVPSSTGATDETQQQQQQHHHRHNPRKSEAKPRSLSPMRAKESSMGDAKTPNGSERRGRRTRRNSATHPKTDAKQQAKDDGDNGSRPPPSSRRSRSRRRRANNSSSTAANGKNARAPSSSGNANNNNNNNNNASSSSRGNRNSSMDNRSQRDRSKSRRGNSRDPGNNQRSSSRSRRGRSREEQTNTSSSNRPRSSSASKRGRSRDGPSRNAAQRAASVGRRRTQMRDVATNAAEAATSGRRGSDNGSVSGTHAHASDSSSKRTASASNNAAAASSSSSSRRGRRSQRPAESEDRKEGSTRRKSVGRRRTQKSKESDLIKPTSDRSLRRPTADASRSQPTRKGSAGGSSAAPTSPKRDKPKAGMPPRSPKRSEESQSKKLLSNHLRSTASENHRKQEQGEDASEESSRLSAGPQLPLLQFDPTNANFVTAIHHDKGATTASDRITNPDGTQSEFQVRAVAGLPTFEDPSRFHDSGTCLDFGDPSESSEDAADHEQRVDTVHESNHSNDNRAQRSHGKKHRSTGRVSLDEAIMAGKPSSSKSLDGERSIAGSAVSGEQTTGERSEEGSDNAAKNHRRSRSSVSAAMLNSANVYSNGNGNGISDDNDGGDNENNNTADEGRAHAGTSRDKQLASRFAPSHRPKTPSATTSFFRRKQQQMSESFATDFNESISFFTNRFVGKKREDLEASMADLAKFGKKKNRSLAHQVLDDDDEDLLLS